jgi:hypothetical protein
MQDIKVKQRLSVLVHSEKVLMDYIYISSIKVVPPVAPDG